MNHFSNRKQRSAFTLVELLTVIALIAILGAIIGLSFPQGGGGSLRAGESIAASMLQGARSAAVLNQTTAMLIINNNPDNPDRWRYMGIVYWDEDNNFWKAVNDGVRLPGDIYFVPPGYQVTMVDPGSTPPAEMPFSDIPRTGSAPEGLQGGPQESFSDTVDGTLSLAFPRIAPTSGDEENWYAYVFDSSGLSLNAGGTLIVAYAETVGPEDETDSIKNIRFPSAAQAGGFAIRRTGSATRIPDPQSLK